MCPICQQIRCSGATAIPKCNPLPPSRIPCVLSLTLCIACILPLTTPLNICLIRNIGRLSICCRTASGEASWPQNAKDVASRVRQQISPLIEHPAQSEKDTDRSGQCNTLQCQTQLHTGTNVMSSQRWINPIALLLCRCNFCLPFSFTAFVAT